MNNTKKQQKQLIDIIVDLFIKIQKEDRTSRAIIEQYVTDIINRLSQI